MPHLMSPTAVAALLLLAATVDYMSIGPNSLRDRIAFLLALPAIREGWDGSKLDAWTVDKLTALIDSALKSPVVTGSYVAAASARLTLSVAIGCLAIYAVGALMPDKMAAKFGRWAALKFPTGKLHRINTKLWVLAVLLGMLADLPGGNVGLLLTAAVESLVAITATLPITLFGVS